MFIWSEYTGKNVEYVSFQMETWTPKFNQVRPPENRSFCVFPCLMPYDLIKADVQVILIGRFWFPKYPLIVLLFYVLWSETTWTFLVVQELDHVVEELEKIAVVNLLQHRSIISLIGNVQRSSLILEKVRPTIPSLGWSNMFPSFGATFIIQTLPWWTYFCCCCCHCCCCGCGCYYWFFEFSALHRPFSNLTDPKY